MSEEDDWIGWAGVVDRGLADLESSWTLGHCSGVARLAGAAPYATEHGLLDAS